MASDGFVSALDNTVLTVRKKPGPAPFVLPRCAYIHPNGEQCTQQVKRLKSRFCCPSHAHMNRPRTTTPKPAPTPSTSRASAYITTIED